MTAGVDEDIYQTAWKLHTLGWSVIPSGGGESGKAPLVPWARWQHEQPTDQEMHAWQDQLRPHLWGIVTGQVVVFDCDTPEAAQPFEGAGLKFHVRTPRGGVHYYFSAPGFPVATRAGLLLGLDIRADGGFVNVVGSNGRGRYEVGILPTPEAIYRWEQLPPAVAEALKAKPRAQADTVAENIPQGQRNATLLSLAGSMRRRGMVLAAIEPALLETNRLQCQPPLPDDEVRAIAASVVRYPPAPPNGTKEYICISPLTGGPVSDRDICVTDSVTFAPPRPKGVTPLATRIDDWLKDQSGWIDYRDMDRELGIRTDAEKANRRKHMQRLREAGTVESHPRDARLFRYVKVATRLIDFKAAGKRTPLAVRYPFGIEKLFNTYPGNIIALAGAADAGKTAFLLNLVLLNMQNFPIYYQSSEMGELELADRLENFDGIRLEDWNFTSEERSRDFHDVIRPDAINIIDYMEFSGDFYAVADYMRQIHDRLGTGIAVIALQKKRGAELGRGGDFGLEKPRLYLSMDSGAITIRKCKNWRDPERNPNGLTLGFKIRAGCQFTTVRDWHKPEQP